MPASVNQIKKTKKNPWIGPTSPSTAAASARAHRRSSGPPSTRSAAGRWCRSPDLELKVAELAGSGTRPPDLELEVVELAISTLPGRRELVGGREERGCTGDDAELRWRRSAASPARRRWRSTATSLAPARSGLLLAGARQIHRRSVAGADLRHREMRRRSRPLPRLPAAASIPREREDR